MIGALATWALALFTAAVAIFTFFAAIGTVGALFVLYAQLRQVQKDRDDDYVRSLVPFISLDLYDDRISPDPIPLRVYAYGGGVAYNVLVNLRSNLLTIPDYTNIPLLREGQPAESALRGSLGPVFIGELLVGFNDVLGHRHEAWHTVNCASGPLKTTDSLHWICQDNCRVHPLDVKTARLNVTPDASVSA
jgi:hypothetical protein